jgi:hypothetical protein
MFAFETQRIYEEQYPRGLLCKIESYLTLHTGSKGYVGNYATFASAVHGIGNRKALVPIRRALRASQAKQVLNLCKMPVPCKRPKQRSLYYDKRMRRYCVKFPGSDSSVVRNSQIDRHALWVEEHAAQLLDHEDAYDGSSAAAEEAKKKIATPQKQQQQQQQDKKTTKRPRAPVAPYYHAYATVNGYCALFMLVLAALALWFGSAWRCGRRLLLAFPRFFTCGAFAKTGPTQRMIDEASFSMDFYASGWNHRAMQLDESKRVNAKRAANRQRPDRFVHTRLTGMDPGYRGTSVIVVQAALCMLRERTRIPHGVRTPGSAFVKTSLVHRLQDAGLTFERIRDTDE